ncbi:hypothetical protein X770_00850 [Mesorhizobium sp. LSJC269B00]|uniref:hypothetical protein n=1 Tax=Mesorhizobium sp. LSJC269B00 TaxID=1287326 RepID=UPI0003CF1A88|nr:hypothetical protein [Mesorhizobium sp. LSJC269B00]ESW93808.1 hypothetical protein X770_00850 [Mesorhizobium sp. LSJC269B00]
MTTMQSTGGRARQVHHDLAARIDRIAQRGLPERLAKHVADRMSGGDAVVMVRELKVRCRLVNQPSDIKLSDAWAKSLADGISGAIEKHGSSAISDDVCVFSDRAEWLAACICALLTSAAASPPWWFGPLAGAVAGKSTAEALLLILEYDSSKVMPVLARLDGKGVLERFLDALGPAASRELLSSEARAGSKFGADRRNRLRPFLAAAIELLDISCTPGDVEALLAAWPTHANVDEPDWRSRSALADAMLDASRFVVSAGRADHNQMTAAAERSSRFQWVDTDRLRQGLLVHEERRETGDLSSIIKAFQSSLDDSVRDPDRLALRVLSRFARDNSDLGEGQNARTLIQLAAPLVLHLARLPPQKRSSALRACANGSAHLQGLEPGTTEKQRASVVSLLEAIAGEPAQRLPQLVSECGCAGVAVMLRALVDINLSAVVATARLTAPSLPDNPGIVATALLCAWAGPASIGPDGTLDDAILMLLGNHGPRNAGELSAALAEIGTAAFDTLADVIDRKVTSKKSVAAGSEVGQADIDALAGPSILGLDPVISRIAARLLASWSGWLQGFEGSSSAWLLENAVRRRGQIAVEADRLSVILPPLPMDILLRRAGYLDPLVPHGWLPWRQLTFQLDNGTG